MEVSDQLNAPAALPPEKKHLSAIHWIGVWVGIWAGQDAVEKKNVSCSYPESNTVPRQPSLFFYSENIMNVIRHSVGKVHIFNVKPCGTYSNQCTSKS
jgi:hypothetical protein